MQPLGRRSFRGEPASRANLFGAFRPAKPPGVVPRPPSIRIAQASRSKERCSLFQGGAQRSSMQGPPEVGSPGPKDRGRRRWASDRGQGIKVPRRRGVTPGRRFREQFGGDSRNGANSTQRPGHAIERIRRSHLFGWGVPPILLRTCTVTGRNAHRLPAGSAIERSVAIGAGGGSRWAPADLPSDETTTADQEMTFRAPRRGVLLDLHTRIVAHLFESVIASFLPRREGSRSGHTNFYRR